MNKERILALAEKIEKLPHRNREVGGFTMVSYTRTDGECRTPACIAGHAVFEFDKAQWEILGSRDFPHTADIANYLLDLDYNTQGMELFYPTDRHWSDITPVQAASVLRHLAETGEVDWAASET